jgi:hypothetical protein
MMQACVALDTFEDPRGGRYNELLRVFRFIRYLGNDMNDPAR